MSKSQCCSNNGCCCTPQSNKRKITIDFLYLDLSVCTRCQGTDQVLEEAIMEVAHVLKAADIEVVVNKININNREIAIAYRFESSPTIRIDGCDIDMDVKESLCESCGDLCGSDVDCRIWTYQGREYTVPPKAMVVNAILSAVYGGKKEFEQKEYVLPQNLAQFFDEMEKK